jgi:uncharacterized protein (DUF433 family)
MATKQQTYQDRIIIDPRILAGKPVVKGTRIPVALVLAHLAQDLDLKTLFAAYPHLTREDVKACLLYSQTVLTGEGRKHLAQTKATHGDRKRTSVKDALALAGAWADLPSDRMEEELDRIRHESTPTAPIELDL